MDGGRVRREASRTAVTEMVVMRADDDRLVLELWVGARKNADDVVSRYLLLRQVDLQLGRCERPCKLRVRACLLIREPLFKFDEYRRVLHLEKLGRLRS